MSKQTKTKLKDPFGVVGSKMGEGVGHGVMDVGEHPTRRVDTEL